MRSTGTKITLDIDSFIAEVLSFAGSFSGSLFCTEGIIRACRSRRTRAAGNFEAFLNLPTNDNDEADGLLFFQHPKFGRQQRVIAVVGRPIGFGEYRWKALCPKMRKLVHVLYFDPGMNLFVAQEAIGTSPPTAVERFSQSPIIVAYLEKKFGRSEAVSRRKSTEEELRGLEAAIAHVSIPWLENDLLFALNGLPMMSWDGDRVDVLRSIRAAKKVEKFNDDMVLNCLLS